MSRSAAPPPLPTGDGTPRVAVAFDGTATGDDVRAARAAGMDIAEVRIDAFGEPAVDHLDRLAVFADVPTIATIRSAAEGGGWTGPEELRLALYRRALDRAGTVDVEIASSIGADVVASAHAVGRAVIGSFHDFDATPDRAGLEATLAAGEDLGVDIVKIATMVHSPDDVRTLAGFLVDRHDRGLIVIGMGTAGSVTRLLFPFLGSALTFAAHGGPAAPGQPDLAAAATTLRGLSTDYADRHPVTPPTPPSPPSPPDPANWTPGR